MLSRATYFRWLLRVKLVALELRHKLQKIVCLFYKMGGNERKCKLTTGFAALAYSEYSANR